VKRASVTAWSFVDAFTAFATISDAMLTHALGRRVGVIELKVLGGPAAYALAAKHLDETSI